MLRKQKKAMFRLRINKKRFFPFFFLSPMLMTFVARKTTRLDQLLVFYLPVIDAMSFVVSTVASNRCHFMMINDITSIHSSIRHPRLTQSIKYLSEQFQANEKTFMDRDKSISCCLSPSNTTSKMSVENAWNIVFSPCFISFFALI